MNSRVAVLGGVDPDPTFKKKPDPTFKKKLIRIRPSKKPDPDLTFKKKLNPDLTFKKNQMWIQPS